MATILLIEPNRLLAKQYSQSLGKQGNQVTVCQNAQEAILAADTKSPDLVIMELLLGEHSGVEFLYELRSYSEWQAIPIIILSRLPRADLVISDQILQSLGVVSCLYKPETSLQRLGQQVAHLVPAKISST